MIDFKFPLQPRHKYCITQYEELGFSSLTQVETLLQGWENVLFELGSERDNMQMETETCG